MNHNKKKYTPMGLVLYAAPICRIGMNSWNAFWTYEVLLEPSKKMFVISALSLSSPAGPRLPPCSLSFSLLSSAENLAAIPLRCQQKTPVNCTSASASFAVL